MHLYLNLYTEATPRDRMLCLSIEDAVDQQQQHRRTYQYGYSNCRSPYGWLKTLKGKKVAYISFNGAVWAPDLNTLLRPAP